MPMTTRRSTFPNLPEKLSGLAELSENLWWSWRPRARMLFKMLNRQAWKESGHNPDRMLRDLSPEILSAAAENPDYLRHYRLVMSPFSKLHGQKRAALFQWNGGTSSG